MTRHSLLVPNARLLINNKGDIDLFSKLEKVKKIKKNFSKKIEFHDENKIEKKLKNLWKKNIWLDSLSCSTFTTKICLERGIEL